MRQGSCYYRMTTIVCAETASIDLAFVAPHDDILWRMAAFGGSEPDDGNMSDIDHQERANREIRI